MEEMPSAAVLAKLKDDMARQEELHNGIGFFEIQKNAAHTKAQVEGPMPKIEAVEERMPSIEEHIRAVVEKLR